MVQDSEGTSYVDVQLVGSCVELSNLKVTHFLIRKDATHLYFVIVSVVTQIFQRILY